VYHGAVSWSSDRADNVSDAEMTELLGGWIAWAWGCANTVGQHITKMIFIAKKT